MNRKIFLIATVMFLIIGISAVCAEDINQTDDNLKTIDSDVISVDEPANKSFTNLLMILKTVAIH